MLTESAVNGDVDYLRGLKENVIIGRLIPARFDLNEEGRNWLGTAEAEPEPVGILSGPLDGDDSGTVPEENAFAPSVEMQEAIEESPVGDD